MVGSLIIFTREQKPSVDLQTLLEQNQVRWMHAPLICTQGNPIPPMLDDKLDKADWVFFTSANTVQLFLPYLRPDLKIASIGSQTSKLLKEQDIDVTFESSSQYGVDFIKEWASRYGDHQAILFPHSDLANPTYPKMLQELGHDVYAWPLYQTVANQEGIAKIRELLSLKEPCVWTFASPSAWDVFYQEGLSLPKHHQIGVIGETTAKAVLDCGVSVNYIPSSPSMVKLVELIIKEIKEHEF